MKAKTDLYCPKCGAKIYEKGDELMSLIFPRAEERCSQCDTMLTRRTPGGQSNPWNFHTQQMRAEMDALGWMAKVDPHCLTAFEKRFPDASKVVSNGLSENENSPITFTACARTLQTYWTGWVDAKEAK